ncbi:helix-turn-helix transcriptional regulator [Streptomyces sp. BE20]|uniref:helix-turn-helix domain-containing protein n=1 Tax=unclassified Streptomyces TaxID=2593676 RepID=UPI002E7A7EA4|nr:MULTISPECIES: helix-turn-helix transcriptional regulator [unclassified Streptomyces]MED7949483.1 helix-turn-helix transcriptional regulator [Streptomyces sp. BE303]MEE1824460.1 helix-turn-helix transcriptional regulator [Streptomyces sp. BE20]
MAVSASSSVQRARQNLADRLGEIQRDAGLTGRELASACGWYPSKVSRLLNAHTPPSEDDIREWCRACGADERAADLVASLRAVEGMFIEWRRLERAGLKAAQEARLPLYERTHRFRSYSSWLVPGLIQTPGYTTAVLQAIRQRRGLVDDVQAAVAARMERQQVLYAGDRRFAFLVEESVLRCGIGGSGVMRDQLHHLTTVGSLPNASLGVVPMRPDRMRWPAEGFWIFDNAQVNVELVSGYLTITQPSEIKLYAETFGELAELAVYGAAARELITSAAALLG